MSTVLQRLRTFTRIVATGILAGVAYGLVHDQITAHLCVEYFLGALLGLAATLGPWPSVRPQQLHRPILRLLGAMALGAAIMGLLGYLLARDGQLYLHPWLIQTIHPTDPAIYQAVWFAHNASYGFAALGALMLSARTLVGRVRAARA
jgi:hypothetical protein